VVAEFNILKHFEKGNQMHAPDVLEGFWMARAGQKNL